jgi:hypothetical protein
MVLLDVFPLSNTIFAGLAYANAFFLLITNVRYRPQKKHQVWLVSHVIVANNLRIAKQLATNCPGLTLSLLLSHDWFLSAVHIFLLLAMAWPILDTMQNNTFL